MDTLVTLMVIFLTVRMEGGSMSDNSAIEWTDATWNPTTGCTKVSTGCDRCYAERIALRFGRSFDLELHPDRLEQPLTWRRPRRVFVNSVSDLFHRDVPWGFVDQVFGVMEAAGHHTYQLLTKRSSAMRDYLLAKVASSPLPRRRVLRELNVPRSTYYRWLRRSEQRRLEDDAGRGKPPWNRLTSQEVGHVLSAAREMPELSPSQLASWVTDNMGFSVSESTVYRILRREGLVKRPEMRPQVRSTTRRPPAPTRCGPPMLPTSG